MRVKDLDSKVDESLLAELFSQVAIVIKVVIPRDKVTGKRLNTAYVQLRNELEVDYVLQVMDKVKLYDKPLRLSKMEVKEKQSLDVGANLYVGNLDESLSDAFLEELFQSYGTLLEKPIKRPSQQNYYCIVKYDDFVSSDQALAALHHKYLANRRITVTYAYKEGEPGVQHGSQLERQIFLKRAGSTLPEKAT